MGDAHHLISVVLCFLWLLGVRINRGINVIVRIIELVINVPKSAHQLSAIIRVDRDPILCKASLELLIAESRKRAARRMRRRAHPCLFSPRLCMFANQVTFLLFQLECNKKRRNRRGHLPCANLQ